MYFLDFFILHNFTIFNSISVNIIIKQNFFKCPFGITCINYDNIDTKERNAGSLNFIYSHPLRFPVRKKKKTRRTPGPEWPTEALTAYQIGGTRTWMLEYPKVPKEDEQNLKSVGKRPLKATTCYYVILRDEREDSLESSEGDYNQGNSLE